MKTFKEQTNSITISQTLAFIKKAHSGQMYGKDPYWIHPKAVADTGKKFFGSKFNKNAYIVALLHDVIEDTPYSDKDLLEMGYSKEIVDSVKLLSKDTGLDYDANIQRIIASGNTIAMMVKFCDNMMNYTGTKEGSKWTPEKIKHSTAKYKKSLESLAKKLNVSNDKLAPIHAEIEKRYNNK